MNIDLITQYILSLVPAVTAVVGMVVSVGVGIGTIRRANSDTLDKIEKSNNDVIETNKNFKDELEEVHKENAQLKRDMAKLMAKIEHIHFVEEE